MSNKPIPTRTIYCSFREPEEGVINEAAEMIKTGGLVVYPTETFYGLGADPKNPSTIKRVFDVKGRSHDKPLPLILDNTERLEGFARNITPYAKRLIDAFWPGPLTLIFNCVPGISSLLTAGTGKIALRCSKAPIAKALTERIGGALISTSANLSGNPSITDSDDLFKDLNGLVDIIIDSGKLSTSAGSTILDITCEPFKAVRWGDISEGEIRLALNAL